MSVEWERRVLGILGVIAFTIVVGSATIGARQRGGAAASQGDEFRVDPTRGPIDLGLTDPALIGAIDVHAHLDPDSPGVGAGTGGRSIDIFDFAKLAQARGMRGFVYKNPLDYTAAGAAYLVRKHIAPSLEVFGRMAANMATGGINVVSVEHFSQIRGGGGAGFSNCRPVTRRVPPVTRNQEAGRGTSKAAGRLQVRPNIP